MNEILEIVRDFAASTTGRIVLIGVAVLVLFLMLPPLWRSLKYLAKALVWALLALLVLALGAAAVWVWMKKEAADPSRLEAVEREAVEAVRSGWTNRPADSEMPVREE
jgi:hypothetical protein